MLCNIRVCSDDIYDEVELKCAFCNGFLHFGCVALQESAFRKMSKSAKRKWISSKCKFSNDFKSKIHLENTTEGYEAHVLTNESFKNLTDSVNFMSERFDVFNKQLHELILSMKDLREENKILKEQSNDLRIGFNLLSKKVNNLEQKSLDDFFEVVGVPNINNEDCKLKVKKIATALNVEIDVVNAFRAQSNFNNRPNKIVAEVSMKQCKRVLMETARKTKLTGIRVDSSWKNEAIYMNDRLTQFNRNLFFKTKAFARDNGYKFVWFKDSKLFIKKMNIQ